MPPTRNGSRFHFYPLMRSEHDFEFFESGQFIISQLEKHKFGSSKLIDSINISTNRKLNAKGIHRIDYITYLNEGKLTFFEENQSKL